MSDQQEQVDKPEKKSEAIEIRVPFDTKQRFMETCKADERTASDVLRDAIDTYLERGGFGLPRRRLLSIALLGSVAVALGMGVLAYRAQEQNQGLAEAQQYLLQQNESLIAEQQKRMRVSDAFSAAWGEQVDAAGNPLAHLYFGKTDTDGDDRLTLEEFVQGIKGRGSISNNNLGPDETILRTVGVGLVMPVADADALRQKGLLEGCFATLAEIGDAERSREFYALDTDKNNLLTRTEFAKSERIPTLYELRHDFISKDGDVDGLLSFDEAQEDIDAWTQVNATNENRSTRVTEGDVPEACRLPDAEDAAGRLYIKFERLKRFISTDSRDGNTKGVSNSLFAKLDLNRDGKLSFREFVAWYNMGVGDVTEWEER